MTQINSISSNLNFNGINNVNQSQNVQTQRNVSFGKEGDTVDFSNKKPIKSSLTGKKWGVGIASAFIPGLGQACNGQWGKAGLFFGTAVVCQGISLLTAAACPPVAIIACLCGLTNRVVSVVNSVKNAN